MMLTRISKILAVFFVVGSLAFMGFAIAVTFGEPDLLQALSDKAFNGYTVIKQEGAGGLWEAKRGRDGGSVASSKVLPEVLVKVLNEVDQANRQEIQALKERQDALQLKRDQLVAARIGDEIALQTYESEARRQLASLRQQEADKAAEVISATTQAQKLEVSVAARREDVFRLKQQVREIQADNYRLQQIQAQLENLQVQLQDEVTRSEERKAQLQERLGTTYEPSSKP